MSRFGKRVRHKVGGALIVGAAAKQYQLVASEQLEDLLYLMTCSYAQPGLVTDCRQPRRRRLYRRSTGYVPVGLRFTILDKLLVLDKIKYRKGEEFVLGKDTLAV